MTDAEKKLLIVLAEYLALESNDIRNRLLDVQSEAAYARDPVAQVKSGEG